MQRRDILDQYYDQFPEGTIKEFLEFEQQVRDSMEKAERDSEQCKIDFFDSLIGRYFKIKFHNNSCRFFKVTDNLYKNQLRYERYSSEIVEISLNSSRTGGSVLTSKNTYCNYLWFLGQCKEVWVEHIKNRVDISVTEISQEMFDTLLSEYTELEEKYNESTSNLISKFI